MSGLGHEGFTHLAVLDRQFGLRFGVGSRASGLGFRV